MENCTEDRASRQQKRKERLIAREERKKIRTEGRMQRRQVRVENRQTLNQIRKGETTVQPPENEPIVQNQAPDLELEPQNEPEIQEGFLEWAEETESISLESLLNHIMGTKNAHQLPGALKGGNLIASLFHAFSPRHGDEDKPYFSQHFQVVALPQTRLDRFELRPGDLLIQRMYAHPKRARMGVVKEVFGKDKVSMISDKGIEIVNIGEMGKYLNWEMMGVRKREEENWGEDIKSPPPLNWRFTKEHTFLTKAYYKTREEWDTSKLYPFIPKGMYKEHIIDPNFAIKLNSDTYINICVYVVNSDSINDFAKTTLGDLHAHFYVDSNGNIYEGIYLSYQGGFGVPSPSSTIDLAESWNLATNTLFICVLDKESETRTNINVNRAIVALIQDLVKTLFPSSLRFIGTLSNYSPIPLGIQTIRNFNDIKALTGHKIGTPAPILKPEEAYISYLVEKEETVSAIVEKHYAQFFSHVQQWNEAQGTANFGKSQLELYIDDFLSINGFPVREKLAIGQKAEEIKLPNLKFNSIASFKYDIDYMPIIGWIFGLSVSNVAGRMMTLGKRTSTIHYLTTGYAISPSSGSIPSTFSRDDDETIYTSSRANWAKLLYKASGNQGKVIFQQYVVPFMRLALNPTCETELSRKEVADGKGNAIYYINEISMFQRAEYKDIWLVRQLNMLDIRELVGAFYGRHAELGRQLDRHIILESSPAYVSVWKEYEGLLGAFLAKYQHYVICEFARRVENDPNNLNASFLSERLVPMFERLTEETRNMLISSALQSVCIAINQGIVFWMENLEKKDNIIEEGSLIDRSPDFPVIKRIITYSLYFIKRLSQVSEKRLKEREENIKLMTSIVSDFVPYVESLRGIAKKMVLFIPDSLNNKITKLGEEALLQGLKGSLKKGLSESFNILVIRSADKSAKDFVDDLMESVKSNISSQVDKSIKVHFEGVEPKFLPPWTKLESRLEEALQNVFN